MSTCAGGACRLLTSDIIVEVCRAFRVDPADIVLLGSGTFSCVFGAGSFAYKVTTPLYDDKGAYDGIHAHLNEFSTAGVRELEAYGAMNDKSSETTPEVHGVVVLCNGTIGMKMTRYQGTLHDLLRHHGKGLGVQYAQYVFSALVKTLAAMPVGYMNRDIKPGNILLKSNGAVVLGDWGLARATLPIVDQRSSSCRRKGLLGTSAPKKHQRQFCTGTRANVPCIPPAQELSPLVITMWYAPPNVLKKSGYDPLNVDVWSIGVVLLEVLIGRYPFIESHTASRERFFEECVCPYLGGPGKSRSEYAAALAALIDEEGVGPDHPCVQVLCDVFNFTDHRLRPTIQTLACHPFVTGAVLPGVDVAVAVEAMTERRRAKEALGAKGLAGVCHAAQLTYSDAGRSTILYSKGVKWHHPKCVGPILGIVSRPTPETPMYIFMQAMLRRPTLCTFWHPFFPAELVMDMLVMLRQSVRLSRTMIGGVQELGAGSTDVVAIIWLTAMVMAERCRLYLVSKTPKGTLPPTDPITYPVRIMIGSMGLALAMILGASNRTTAYPVISHLVEVVYKSKGALPSPHDCIALACSSEAYVLVHNHCMPPCIQHVIASVIPKSCPIPSTEREWQELVMSTIPRVGPTEGHASKLTLFAALPRRVVTPALYPPAC